MDAKAINKELLTLLFAKVKLGKLTYDDKNYDNAEEDLHDLEDDFLDKYGDYFEEVLEQVHEKYKMDSDVLLPIAYLPKEVIEAGKNDDGSVNYDVKAGEGVAVDLPKAKDARLVLLPNPARLVLVLEGAKKEVIWKA